MAGLYLHIPFCESRCSYCDFTTFAKQQNTIESYFKALYTEIELQAKQNSDMVFESIYFGGGTPSFVDASYIKKTLNQLQKHFKFAKEIEITIEMNPNSATEDKINIYKSCGINRFSIGLQTAIDSQLKEINRKHTLKDFHHTTQCLQNCNFSVDIMIGLKNQTLADILYSITQAIEAKASHISVYALTVEENTPIYATYKAGLLPSAEDVAMYYEKIVEFLKENGYMRYEVSNFAKMGKESKHNLIYWQAKAYLGIGLSASSYIKGKRFTNTTNLQDYINKLNNRQTAIAITETIDSDEAKFEFIMLALRLATGIQLAEYTKRFNSNFLQEYKTVLEKNKRYLNILPNRVTIKEEYMFVQNSILVDFLIKKKRE